jgi:hypothetical protein
MTSISGASIGARKDEVANLVYSIQKVYTVYNISVYSLSLSTAPLETDEKEV